MSDTQIMIDETVTKVLSGIIDDRCINALKRIAVSGGSAEMFVRTLVLRKVGDGESLDSALPEIQLILENIADSAEPIGCIFMSYLWPIASSQIGMHDVCNSIDLWLANNNQSEVTEHWKHIASTTEDESVRAHFRQMVPVTK